MSKTINNKEYRLKLFKEKIDKSTLKIENNINDKKQNKYIKCPHCKSEDVYNRMPIEKNRYVNR